MRKGKGRTAYFFLLPSLAGTAVFVFIPFADVIRRSFFRAVGGVFVGFSNYREVLQNEMFRMALSNTARFLIVCLPPSLSSTLSPFLSLFLLPG